MENVKYSSVLCGASFCRKWLWAETLELSSFSEMRRKRVVSGPWGSSGLVQAATSAAAAAASVTGRPKITQQHAQGWLCPAPRCGCAWGGRGSWVDDVLTVVTTGARRPRLCPLHVVAASTSSCCRTSFLPPDKLLFPVWGHLQRRANDTEHFEEAGNSAQHTISTPPSPATAGEGVSLATGVFPWETSRARAPVRERPMSTNQPCHPPSQQ